MSLEKRMYGYVPYQLNGRQAGIQFGHAIVEYSLEHYGEEYIDFAKNHKTFIMLDGGTTSDRIDELGTMNLKLNELKHLGLKISEFREPDMGRQLLAFVFILDERFFDSIKYPLFEQKYPTLGLLELDIKKEIEISYNVDVFGSDENAKIAKIVRSSRLANN